MGSCRKSPKLNQKDIWHALWTPLNHTNYARKVYGMVSRPNFIRLLHILIANSAPMSHRGCGFLSVFKKYTIWLRSDLSLALHYWYVAELPRRPCSPLLICHGASTPPLLSITDISWSFHAPHVIKREEVRDLILIRLGRKSTLKAWIDRMN